MKKFMIVVIVIAVLLVLGGIAGNVLSRNYNIGINTSYTEQDYPRGGMMYESYSDSDFNQDEILGIDELEENVKDYISEYDENLVISDIFIYEDSDYYFSIMEQDTGIGAMELLVNPYTGYVYPEYGPNMMWNIKYGMHNNNSYGIMNKGWGMMGRNYGSTYYSSDINFEGNTISLETAKEAAQTYLDEYIDQNYQVSDDVHEFYGYYTFHIDEAGNTVGMLSVNGLTGEVWYHTWHGTLTEVIEGHDD